MSNAALTILPKDDPDAVSGDGLDTAEKSIYFDKGSKKFWFQGLHGEWIGYDKQFAQLYLKQFKALSGAASKEHKISDMERELLRVAMEDYVSYAGPLAGWKKGFYNTGGDRILVTRSPSMIEPVEGEWPVLNSIFEAVLGGKDAPEDNEHAALIDQRPFFFAWWKFGLQCLRECYPDRGLAMVLAGEAGSGKTLVKQLVNQSFGGREVYPYSFMIGRDNFNAEMLEAELWTVDDETADTSIQARTKFGAEIKKITANSAMRFRGMMREAVTLNTFKRLFICVNREPDRLMVLPPMDDDVRGKICMLLAYNSKLFAGIEQNSPEQKRILSETIERELPHFLHWLLFTFAPGDELNGRFGSREFHHPELTE